MTRRNRLASLGSLMFAVLLMMALFGALLWTVQSSRAATFEVEEGESIQAAIDSAGPGDTIRVEGGIFTESLVISKSLTLEGGYDSAFENRVPRTSIISLTTEGRVIKVEGASLDVTIDGFEIRGGALSQEPGAGMYIDVVNGGQINILDNLIHSNSTVGGTDELQISGGGLRMDLKESSAQIRENDILSNTPEGYGGGIWLMLDQSSDVEIISNTIEDSSAKQGAGIGGYIDQSLLTIDNNILAGNSLNGNNDGGNVYLSLSHGANVLITGTEIVSSSAQNGGGVYAMLDQAAYLRVVGSKLRDNESRRHGGGIYTELHGHSRVDFQQNDITYNHADNSGGGIYIKGEDRPFVTFIDNIVAVNAVSNTTGGGIHTELAMSGTLYLNDNQIVNNTNFNSDGGGVYTELSDFMSFEVKNNEIVSNTADEYGGIYFYADHNVTGYFEHNDVYANVAVSDDYGGGYIALEDNVTMAFKDNEFSQNTAGRNYGGLGLDFTNHSYVAGDHLVLSDNTAAQGYGGGGIDISYNAAFTMTESMTVTGNVAQTYKVGGLSLSGESDTRFFVPNMYVFGNVAHGQGGGLELNLVDGRNTVIATEVQILSNTAASEGGGIWASLSDGNVLDLSDSLFVQNIVTGTETNNGGGGFYLDRFKPKAVLKLANVEFLSNTADYEGGGAYFSGPSNDAYLDLRSAIFISNTARSDYGGGMYLGNQSNRAQVNAEDTIFKLNRAGGAGGGMYLDTTTYGATISLDRSVFLSNTAGLEGGGFYGDEIRRGASFHQVEGTFSHNESGGDGGAIYWNDGILAGSVFNFDYITITHNMAAGGGGGMYVGDVLANNGAWASFTHNQILSNTAQGSGGGGIYFWKLATTGSTVYFNHNVLRNNKAGEDFGGSGGGARLGEIEGSDVEFRENRIVNNTATDMGGGLYIGQVNKGTLDFAGNEISQNTIYSTPLKHGGGLYFEQMKLGAVVTMTNNILTGNRATGNGGGCYIKGDVDEGVTYIFRQNHVDHNIAEHDGGGCYFVEAVDNNVIKSSMLKLIDNTFNYNTAAGSYGGVFLADLKNSHLRFWENQLIGNRAGISGTVATGGNGGGIYFTAIDLGSVVDFRDNEVISNTAYVSPTGELGAYAGLYAGVSNGSVLAIQGSRFERNEAESDYAGIYTTLVDNARLRMARTVITDNIAAYKNGGVSIISLEDRPDGYSQYFLEQNKIINNLSGERCGLSIIDVVDDAPPLWGQSINNVIAGNESGAVHLENVDFHSTNDTIADNVGAGFSVSGTITSTIYFNNGILWDNTMNLTITYPVSQSRLVAAYSDVQGGAPGTGNLNQDPRFVDPSARDYHLTNNTPLDNRIPPELAPAVDHDGVPRPAPAGGDADMGAYEYRVAGVWVTGDGLLTGDPGEMVTHIVTIENSGSAQDAFDLTLSDNTWPTTLSTGEVLLEADESVDVSVWVEVPLGLSRWMTDSVRVIATSQRNAGNTHSDAVETEVGLAPAVSLTPDNSAVALANSVQRYQHIIVNEGNGEDIFVMDASSSQEWLTTVDPISVTLAEGLSETLEVTVWVPEGTGGLVDTTVVTATSLFDGNAFASAWNDTTVVGSATPPALSLTPDRGANVVANRQHVYEHTLTNLGTQADAFTLTAVSDAGWPVAPSAVIQTLGGGQSTSLYVTVTVPADSEHQQVDVTTLTATSHRDSRVTDSASDRTTALRPSDLELSTLTTNYVNADTSTDYVHRLTNWSHLEDTVALTVASSQGWPVTVTPPTVTFAGNTDRWVTVTVFVPLTSTHNEIDQTQLTAVSGNDGKQVSVVDMTVAQKPSDLTLYPDRTGTAIVGMDKVYTHTLVNDGDYTDTVSLEVSGPVSDWQTDLSPTSVELAPGMSTTVVVTVSVPVDEATGEHFLVSLEATSSNDGGIVVVTDLTTAQRPSHLSLTSNNPTSVLIGQQATYYQHLLTNESALTDTVTLDATSSQGWAVDVGPRTVTLGPDMAATVAVTLSLPAEGSNGTMDITTVEARSDNGGGALAAAASDVTTLLNPASIQLQASQAFSTEAGSTVIYEHSLINAGDYQDVFSLEAVSDQGWETILTPTQARLSPGEGVSITLRVTVPATATPGMVDRTTLSAISTYDREREAAVTNVDTTHISGGKIYLPLVLRTL